MSNFHQDVVLIDFCYHSKYYQWNW